MFKIIKEDYVDNDEFISCVKKVFGNDKDYKIILEGSHHCGLVYKNNLKFYVNYDNKNGIKVYFRITGKHVGNKFEFKTSLLDLVKKCKEDFENYCEESHNEKKYILWVSLDYKDYHNESGYITDTVEGSLVTDDKERAMLFDSDEQAENYLNSLEDNENFEIDSASVELK